MQVCMVTTDSTKYHRIGNVVIDDGPSEMWRWTTQCGNRISPTWGIRSIPEWKARLLADPCGHCFKAVGE